MIKPYFETENGKLYHGDCMEILPQLDPVDLVLTDIPYGEVNKTRNSDKPYGKSLRIINKKDADTKTFCEEQFVNLCLKKTIGCVYIFCCTEQISIIRKTMVENGLSTRLGIWEKTNPSPMNGEFLWLSGIECFVYGKKKLGTHNVKCKNPVFRNKIQNNQLHPTQKPKGVILEMILASSNINDTVLDPCFGSGTIGVVCEELNRKWIGIEISEKYCEIAAKRIDSEIKQQRFDFKFNGAK